MTTNQGFGYMKYFYLNTSHIIYYGQCIGIIVLFIHLTHNVIDVLSFNNDSQYKNGQKKFGKCSILKIFSLAFKGFIVFNSHLGKVNLWPFLLWCT